MWIEAADRPSSSAEHGASEPVRKAWDGRFYTREQFLEYYGMDGERMWKDAADLSAGLAEHGASEPVSYTQPAETVTVLCRPPELAEPSIFTPQDFKNLACALIGGKAACIKQRELRAQLLATTDSRDVDLTFSDFNWKAMLKSLPCGAELVGTGISKFSFRLLSDVRDHNYIKLDTGERHVFEVKRSDGSAAHLHFHKNGKLDKPEFFNQRPTQIGAGEPDRGGPRMELHRPATFADIVESETPGDRLPLGRTEATMALESLLHATHQGNSIQALNITDGIAFSWRRCLRNTVKNREIIRDGISAVYAVKPLDQTVPKLLFCHPDSSYTYVFFPNENKTIAEHMRDDRWQDLIILQNAVYSGRSWMDIRTTGLP